LGGRTTGGIAEELRVELAVRGRERRVDGLGKRDGVALLRPEVEDPEHGLAVRELVQHDVVLEDVEVLEHHVGTVRHDLLPEGLAGRLHGSGHEAEVAAARVRADEELLAALVDVVLRGRPRAPG
jgi:hypothetical protein